MGGINIDRAPLFSVRKACDLVLLTTLIDTHYTKLSLGIHQLKLMQVGSKDTHDTVEACRQLKGVVIRN